MNENSPIWASDTEIESAVAPAGRAAAPRGRRRRLAQQDHGERGDRPGASTRMRGSNSMPTETKNSTAKASRIGSASVAARWLNSDSPHDHAGEERAQRHRDAEQLGGAERDRQRHAQHGQREQLARAGMGDA